MGAHSLTFFPILPYLNAFLGFPVSEVLEGFAAFGGSPLGAHSLIGKNREESETVSPQRLQNPPKPPKQGTPGPGCQTSPKECIKIGKNREESETVSPQRLQNPPKPPKQGTPGPGCQTSPKECIKIGKNREESETVSPQMLQNPPKPPKQGRKSETVSPPRLQNLQNPQNLRNREPQGSETGNPRARMPNVT